MRRLILVICLCILVIACTKQDKDIEKIQEPLEESAVVETTESISESEKAGDVSVSEEDVKEEQAQIEEAKAPQVQKGTLVMQLTDKKPELNITSLIVTISDVKVHMAGAGESSGQICTNNSLVNEVCVNNTINDTITVCVNQTIIYENCSNSTVNETNETTVVCTNESRIEEVCNDTINQTIIEECHNETEIVEECTDETTNASNWFTVVDETKTFDLIQIQGVKEFLGSKELGAGRYTQIRLSVDDAKLMIGGEVESLKIPSEKIKLVKSFIIEEGETTTLTLDFDAEKSVHQAGSKYVMKPTIKVIQE